ncbi:hypothetical protein KC19_VG125700 [Ceratodon purpureus]|uniref:Uncharacterized protein n=1 Tax=Ceratodon purpureus TaxID=3225 RepID=A0A8T0HPI7_CERPU|nr:hypothetical protein KC19_VG125700 [Ceratodon purpureus]
MHRSSAIELSTVLILGLQPRTTLATIQTLAPAPDAPAPSTLDPQLLTHPNQTGPFLTSKLTQILALKF